MNQKNGGYEGLENGEQGQVLPSSTSHQSKEVAVHKFSFSVKVNLCSLLLDETKTSAILSEDRGPNWKRPGENFASLL